MNRKSADNYLQRQIDQKTKNQSIPAYSAEIVEGIVNDNYTRQRILKGLPISFDANDLDDGLENMCVLHMSSCEPDSYEYSAVLGSVNVVDADIALVTVTFNNNTFGMTIRVKYLT